MFEKKTESKFVKSLNTKISEFSRKNQEINFNKMEVAPLRSFPEFLGNKSRFQIPNFNDEERWFKRIVNNLLFYQTNYFLSALVIFMFVAFLHPQEICLGIFLMAFAFALSMYLNDRKVELRNFKRDHPIVVNVLVLMIGSYLVYKLASIFVFFLGIVLPIAIVVIHASLRMRNTANKIVNAGTSLGVGNKTPMLSILRSIGIEPEFKMQ